MTQSEEEPAAPWGVAPSATRHLLRLVKRRPEPKALVGTTHRGVVRVFDLTQYSKGCTVATLTEFIFGSRLSKAIGIIGMEVIDAGTADACRDARLKIQGISMLLSCAGLNDAETAIILNNVQLKLMRLEDMRRERETSNAHPVNPTA
jgi:hypothetical protein